jgi:GTP-binding protein
VTKRKLDPTQIVDASYAGGAGVSVGTGRDAAAAGHEQLPPPTIAEVAFAGRSNVGKSSLINALVDRRGLVRTSSTPGSTRQINVFEARARDGTLFRLVDLPGYGFTRRSKAEQGLWAALIEGYLRHRVTLAAVVLLVDARRGLLADDAELIGFIESARDAARRPVQVILVATKLDKLPRSGRKSTLDRIARAIADRRRTPGAVQPLIGFSAVSGEGIGELWAAIRRATLGTGGLGEQDG